MGLLEYRANPSLRDVAHDGVLCTFSTTVGQPQTRASAWCGLSGQAEWTVHHIQNHTLWAAFLDHPSSRQPQ